MSTKWFGKIYVSVPVQGKEKTKMQHKATFTRKKEKTAK